MSLRFLTFYGLLLVTGACSTVAEIITEPTSSATYQRKKDDEGNTVYRRERIIHEGDEDDDDDDNSLAYSLVDLAQGLSYLQPTGSDMTLAQSNPGTVDLSLSSESESSEMNSGLSFSFFAQKETTNLDLAYELMGDVISWDFGVALVSSDKTYLGFSTMARLQGPWKFSPYVGAGLYGGDSKTCQTQPLGYGYSEEICEKYFLFSITAEAGLRYLFNDRAQIRVGARHFTNTRQNDPLGRTLYGMNLGVLF